MKKIVAVTNRKLCYEFHPEYELLDRWGEYEKVLYEMETAERKMCTSLLIQLEKLAGRENIEFIILREKDLELGDYMVLANEAMKICRRFNKELVVHYYYEAACMSCRVINENDSTKENIKKSGIWHLDDESLDEIMIRHEKELTKYMQHISQYKHTTDAIGNKDIKLGIHLPLWKFRELLERFANEGENSDCIGCIGNPRDKRTDRRTGVSIHSVDEAVEAEKLGATYLVVGNIYETDCKKGLPGRGLGFLEEVCKAVTIPVYAIGGITKDRLPDIEQAGAEGGCMMSAVMR